MLKIYLKPSVSLIFFKICPFKFSCPIILMSLISGFTKLLALSKLTLYSKCEECFRNASSRHLENSNVKKCFCCQLYWQHLTVSLSRSGADQGKRHRTFLFLYFNCFKRTELALNYNNHQFTKMKFSIKDFFSKCDQMDSFMQIWSHLLKKSSKFHFSCSAYI